jgi:hypothetical protein
MFRSIVLADFALSARQTDVVQDVNRSVEQGAKPAAQKEASVDEPWMSSARRPESFEFQFYVLPLCEFYFGDPNSHVEIENPKFYVSLPNATDPDRPQAWVAFTDVLKDPNRLVDNYRAVAEFSLKYRRPLGSNDAYFWSRGFLKTSIDDHYIYFPWNDSVTEFNRFFEWIEADEGEGSYSDADQGWELNGVRKGDDIYLSVSGDNGEDRMTIVLDVSKLRAEIRRAQTDAEAVSKILVEKLGVNTTAQQPYGKSPKFGTSEWNPSNHR